MELVKNAYDADATVVRVTGTDLDNKESAVITVDDDGIGMTEREFRAGFLRIAARLKTDKGRQSRVYGRQYTGAKGIGRLAAHKMSSLLHVESKSSGAPGIDATIDWNALERFRDLARAGNAVSISRLLKSRGSGTTITLNRLRRNWTPTQIFDFSTAASSYEPDVLFTSALPASVVTTKLIFQRPRLRESTRKDPGFSLQLEGAFAAGEDYWTLLASEVQWIIELRARRTGVTIVVAPSKATVAANHQAAPWRHTEGHPDPTNGPFFDARFFVRLGRLANDTMREFSRRNAGVRVFVEGFRIPPYGDPGNDWLGLAGEYAVRTKSASIKFFGDDEEFDAGLLKFPPSAVYGAVFLTENGAPGLETVVNREGFIPGPSLDTLRDLCRDALYAAVRVRARYERGKPAKPHTPGVAQHHSEFASAHYVRGVLDEALQTVDVASEEFGPESLAKARDTQRAMFDGLVVRLSGDLEMLRVLASVGLQLTVFTHEIKAALTAIANIETVLSTMQAESSIAKRKRLVKECRSLLDELKRSLERQASYLVDARLPDFRRRRRRQNVWASFEGARTLFNNALERDNILVDDAGLDRQLQSPRMFSAELRTVFSNLFSNAIKAVQASTTSRRIRISSAVNQGEVSITMQNSGSHVQIETAEELFRPFVSSNSKVDPNLGRGMGLGLPITRSILEVYDADVTFVKPSRGFATAIQIKFPAES